MNGLNGFSHEDKTHVGEEMADVFIYCTRLSDLCMLDLADAAKERLSLGFPSSHRITSKPAGADKKWQNITFDDVIHQLHLPGSAFKLS